MGERRLPETAGRLMACGKDGSAGGQEGREMKTVIFTLCLLPALVSAQGLRSMPNIDGGEDYYCWERRIGSTWRNVHGGG